MVKSQVNSPKKRHKPPFTKCGKTFSYNIFFFLIRYTHLSTDEKNDKNVATLVEHSKTDLVNVELFDLVKYHES